MPVSMTFIARCCQRELHNAMESTSQRREFKGLLDIAKSLQELRDRKPVASSVSMVATRVRIRYHNFNCNLGKNRDFFVHFPGIERHGNEFRPQDGQNAHEGTPMLIGKGRVTPGSKKPELVRGVGRWHAVSIQCQGASCQLAHGLKNTRFLSAEAPALPLPHCPRKELCRCLYKHHEDRRGQLRRREEITGLRSNVRVTEERRVERDRRRNDTF